MKKLYRLLFLTTLIVLITGSLAFAQGNRDFEGWSSMEINFKPFKKLSLGVEGELRLKNNFSDIDQYFTQFSIGYRIFDKFTLGGGFRFIRNNDTTGKIRGYENHIRFNFDLSYRHKSGRLAFKYRFRYQNRDELGVSLEEGDFADQHLRFKTTLTYDIKKLKLDPIFSAEIFNRIGTGYENGFDKFRLTVGAAYRTNDFGKIGLFYRMEHSLNLPSPIITDIVMFKYSYGF